MEREEYFEIERQANKLEEQIKVKFSNLEEDIKILKEWVEESKQFEKDYDLKKIAFGTLGQKRIMALENLINKNKELEKIVELMAKDITENDIDEDICRKVKNKTSEKDDCYGDDYDMCKDCVIEFYKKKASE